MIRVQSMLTSSVALLAALMSFSAHAADDQTLPWDGRFRYLTVASLTDKYLTHILTNRQNGTVKPDQWTTVTTRGRSPFNGDTGVATIAVDSEAIFGGQSNFCRSELVQNVAGNTAGTTFFRVSLMKEVPYINLHSWQVVFCESHLFEIRIDASVNPVQLVWYTGGSTEARWSTEFKTKTWYNFGIAVSAGKLALYFSEGDDALALTKTESYNGEVPRNYEFNFGQLTLSNDGSRVNMVEGEQDVLLFNGVSVEDSIPSGTSSSTSTKSSTLNFSSVSASATVSTTPTAAADTDTATATASSVKTPADETTDARRSTDPPASTSESDGDDNDAASTKKAPNGTDAPITKKLGCKVRRN
ncbi:unnamed protein product [Peronospora belbahrii]|uniref:Glycoside hydrolase 131 catalytic N-terminal domain-containing protein n=1 Tax=Peronospora belbahrii TaxID=622444 RepID=A0ABN8CR75_9STRA|nr:unnamed protein product [Peronospora belbahrii]